MLRLNRDVAVNGSIVKKGKWYSLNLLRHLPVSNDVSGLVHITPTELADKLGVNLERSRQIFFECCWLECGQILTLGTFQNALREMGVKC